LQSASQTGSHPTTAPRKPIVAADEPQQSVYQSQLSAHQPKVAIIFVPSREARETQGVKNLKRRGKCSQSHIVQKTEMRKSTIAKQFLTKEGFPIVFVALFQEV